MRQALTIGHDGPTTTAAIEGLWDAGYQSIMRVSDPRDALPLLARFHPDLILVLPDFASADFTAELQRVSEQADAPMIVATRDVDRALDCLGPTASLEGPYDFEHLDEARRRVMYPAQLPLVA